MGRLKKYLLETVLVLLLFLFAPHNIFASPSIINITDNFSSYPNSQIPKYEKFEITFDIGGSSAQNFQLPYDPNPPQGIKDPVTGKPYPKYNGINVYATFTSPSGQTFNQPAFYYQVFTDQNKTDQFGSPKEWFYPTSQYLWKVRFSPNQTGIWQYKLSVEDAGGNFETANAKSFTVGDSSNHGFIKVSTRDSRYFEFSDGTYFPGLGYNMNYDQIDWVNPVLKNQSNFQKMNDNGIQLIRMWLSQWAIFGSSWNPWYSMRGDYDNSLPRAGLITYGADSTEESPSELLALVYSESGSTKNAGNWFDACRFIGGFQAQPAVKQNTKYHIKIRYKATGITGPRDPAFPNFGFVAKVQNPNDGNWHTNCFNGGDPANGVRVSTTWGKNSTDWTYLEGDWNSGTYNFLPIFYLALENVKAIDPATNANPYVFIDTVSIAEDLGNSTYGPNIVTKPSMEQLSYYMERNAYAFDKILNLAKQYGIYLRPVIMEKNELIENEIGADGKKANFDNNNFYGVWRNQSAVRWLQKAWWRYLTARWGYSTNIQSWEATNEADPGNWNHYYQTDELGKFMHCTVFGITVGAGDAQKCNFNHPNSHLVSTSFWSGFPAAEFWKNANYPNVDFADVHKYIPKSGDPTHFNDTALSTYDVSTAYGLGGSNVGKPVIRGETGLTDSGTEPGTQALLADTTAVWLHNFIWGQINPGGVMESYWYTNYNQGSVFYGHLYSPSFDYRNKFKPYYSFIKDVPLNNGNYKDVAAVKNNANLRVWGQKDVVNNRAHVWIANSAHTWVNVVNNTDITPISDIVTIDGFTPNKNLKIEWWNTYTGVINSTSNDSTNAQGQLILTVSNLTTDTAVKIGDYSASPTPLPSKSGDTDGDGDVDFIDFNNFKSDFNTASSRSDFNLNGIVDIFDYNLLVANFGK